MKTCALIWISFFLLTIASHGAPVHNGSAKLATIDGLYSVLPQTASEPALLAQGLGSLLVDPIKFAHLKLTGKIKAIQLTLSGSSLRVVAIDSAGISVLSENVAVASKGGDDSNSVTFHRAWKSADEWGSAKGESVVKLSSQSDGTLLVTVSTISSGRTLIFPRGASKTDSWLKYVPAAELEPSKSEPHKPTKAR